MRASFPSSVVERVARHGAVFHEESASGSYAFEQDGTAWEGWFEDWTSLQVKRQWLKCEGVDGLAFFALGYDAGALVSTVAHSFPDDFACLAPTRAAPEAEGSMH